MSNINQTSAEPFLGRMLRAGALTADANDLAREVGVDSWAGKGSTIFAAAVNKYWESCSNSTAWYWVVSSHEGADYIPVHLVAEIDHLYFDADGASTEEELVERWKRRGIKKPVITILEEKLSTFGDSNGFPGSGSAVSKLHQLFRGLMGELPQSVGYEGAPKGRSPYESKQNQTQR